MKSETTSRLCGSLLLALSTFALPMLANAQSTIGEVFICNYENGSGYKDLMKVRDAYVQQAAKVGLTTPPSFVWQPLKTSSDADFLWFSYFENNTQYGQFADAMNASAEMQKVVQQFEAISDCGSALLARQLIFDGGQQPVATPPAYIHAFACNYRDGVDQTAIADLNSHLKEYLGSSDLYKSFLVFQSVPLTPGPDAPDLRMYTVNENAAAWGARQDALQASEEGQMLVRHFRAVLDCSVSHWSGENVVAAPAS